MIPPTPPTNPAEAAAREIYNHPIHSEGEPGISLEESQSRYDENEDTLKEWERITAIITRHFAALQAERDELEKERDLAKASDAHLWKIVSECMDELEMKDQAPSLMRGEIQEWKCQVGYLKEKEVKATDRAVLLRVEVDDLRAQLAALTAAVEVKDKALAFYADESNWDDRTTASEGGEEECEIWLPEKILLSSSEPGWTVAANALSPKPTPSPETKG